MRCVSLCLVLARKVSGIMTSIASIAIKKACPVEKADELFTYFTPPDLFGCTSFKSFSLVMKSVDISFVPFFQDVCL